MSTKPDSARYCAIRMLSASDIRIGNKEWVIVRPLCCFNSFNEGVVWAAYLSDFVQDG